MTLKKWRCTVWNSQYFDMLPAFRQLSLAELDIERPDSYDISSFGDRTKMTC